MNLCKLYKIAEDGGASHTTVHAVAKSWTHLSYWTTTEELVKQKQLKIMVKLPTLMSTRSV